MRRNFAGLTRTRWTRRRDFTELLPRDFELAEVVFFFVADDFFEAAVDAGFLDFVDGDGEDCDATVVPLRKNAARRTAITLMRDIELQVVYQRKFAPKMERSLSPRIRTSSCVK